MNPAARRNSEYDRLNAYPEVCNCAPAIAGISDGPNTDCPQHGIHQSEPSEAQVEAAVKAFWPAYSAAVKDTRPDPQFGITPVQGHKCNVAGMRAALRAALTITEE